MQKDPNPIFALRSVIFSTGSYIWGFPVMQILFDQVLMLILSISYIQSLNWFIMLFTHYKPGGKTSSVFFLILKDHLPCRLSPFSFSFLLSPCCPLLSILNLIFSLYRIYSPGCSYFSLPSYPNIVKQWHIYSNCELENSLMLSR